MSWDLNEANTNLDWVANGVLGKYTASKLDVYKCPADIPSTTSARPGKRSTQ
jgi:hypothetical protein